MQRAVQSVTNTEGEIVMSTNRLALVEGLFPANSFGGSEEMELLAELEKAQSLFDWGLYPSATPRGSGEVGALPRQEILGLLDVMGYGGCYDETGTDVAFGRRDADGPLETHEGEGGAAGFVFAAPDGSRYVLEYGPAPSVAGHSLPSQEELGAGAADRWGRWLEDSPVGVMSRASKVVGNIKPPVITRQALSGAAWEWMKAAPVLAQRYSRRSAGRWWLHKALSWRVDPRFYERMEFEDLVAEGGLEESYPEVGPNGHVGFCGVASFKEVEPALRFAAELRREMSNRGAVCDPRVVLELHSYRDILPDALWGKPWSPPEPYAPHIQATCGVQQWERESSGALGGHSIQLRRDAPITSQQRAEALGRQAERFLSLLVRQGELSRRLEDPRIPEVRKQDLYCEYRDNECKLESMQSGLSHSTPQLAQLVVSLSRERRELAGELRLSQLLRERLEEAMSV